MAKAPSAIKKAIKKTKSKPGVEERLTRQTERATNREVRKVNRSIAGNTVKPGKVGVEERLSRQTNRATNRAIANTALKNTQNMLQRANKTTTSFAKDFNFTQKRTNNFDRYIKNFDAKDAAKLNTLTTKAARQEKKIKEQINTLKSLPGIPNKAEVLKEVRNAKKGLSAVRKVNDSVQSEQKRKDLLSDNDKRTATNTEYEPTETEKASVEQEQRQSRASEPTQEEKLKNIREKIFTRRNIFGDSNKHTVSDEDKARLKLNRDDLEALVNFSPTTVKDAEHVRDRVVATLQTRDHGNIPTEILETAKQNLDESIDSLKYRDVLAKHTKEMEKDKWGIAKNKSFEDKYNRASSLGDSQLKAEYNEILKNRNNRKEKYFGNVDINHRPVVMSEDGRSYNTLLTNSIPLKWFEKDGAIINGKGKNEKAANFTPIYPDGEKLTDQELYDSVYEWLKSGKKLEDHPLYMGTYDSLSAAIKSAEKAHKEQAKLYDDEYLYNLVIRDRAAAQGITQEQWMDSSVHAPEDIWDPNERRYKNLAGAAEHFNRMVAGEEGFYPGENTNSMMTTDTQFINEMPDEEKNVYNYLFYTKGEDEANKFLDDAKKINSERRADI